MTHTTLCRFDAGGTLSYWTADISSTPYVAVSHVWGNVSWRRVTGIGHMVLASSQKARFLAKELPTLVGSTLFWMDILCIDQRNEAAKLNMAKLSPAIYHNARKTIIVREDGGLQHCCSDAVLSFLAGSFRRPRNEIPREWIQKHMDKHDLQFSEVWLNRIWPMQEALWSNTVQFTICYKTQAEATSEETVEKVMEDRPWLMKPTVMQTFEDLKSLAEAWVYGGNFPDLPRGLCHLWQITNYQEKHATEFVKALLSNGTARRGKAETIRASPLIDRLIDITTHCTTQASEPRDYILAISVDQDWYQLPAGVVSMSFGEVLADFLEQNRQAGTNSGHKIIPKIHAGVLEPLLHRSYHHQLPCIEAPEPLCFQDLRDLFYCQRGDDQMSPFCQHEWSISQISSRDPMEHILNVLSDTFSMLDMRLFVGWGEQYGAWAKNLDRLYFLRRELRNQGNSLTPGDAEVLKMLEEMLPLLATGSIGGILRTMLGSHTRLRTQVPPVFGHEGDDLDSFNITASQDQKTTLAELNTIFIREWYILMQILEYNMGPQTREEIWTTAANFTCGLPLSSLRWTRKHLKPYVLRCQREILVPNQGRTQNFSLLCLSSPKLDVSDLCNIKVGTYGLPVVTASSKRNPSLGVQIIGMAPLMEETPPQGYGVLFDRARVVVLPVQPEPLTQALEEQNEITYRALRHWDAMFEDGLWGLNPTPRPGRATDPNAIRRRGPIQYGTPGISLEELAAHETDDRDPYAYYPGSRDSVPFTHRIILYSVIQWQRYTRPTAGAVSSPVRGGNAIPGGANLSSPQQPPGTIMASPIRSSPPERRGFAAGDPQGSASIGAAGSSSVLGQARAEQSETKEGKKHGSLRRLFGRKREK